MASHQKPREPERPSVDEWGMYDPERTGLAAVWARIEANRRASPPIETFGIARLIYDPEAPAEVTTSKGTRRKK